MRHPTPVEIEDHLLKERVPAVIAHLEECDECTRVARAIESLGDPMTWDIAAMPDPEDLAGSLRRDRATEEVMQQIREAEQLRHVDPAEATRICDLTLELPECASDSEQARHLSVLVLRERANALRVLGHLSEAHETIRRARQLAEGLLVSEYENAVLDYIEGTVRFEQDDLEPIVALARRAGEVLTRFGDEDRARRVRFLTAAIEYKRGDYEGSRATCLSILESIEPGSNPPIEAGVLSNLANCEVSLGRHDDALRHIRESAELYARCGMTTEVTRIRWQEARIAALIGELDSAEARYLEIEREFLSEGLELDAALVALELVEVYQQQERADEVVAIATRLATVFAEAGTRLSLATTLAALREAAVRGEDVTAPVTEARATIEQMIAAG